MILSVCDIFRQNEQNRRAQDPISTIYLGMNKIFMNPVSLLVFKDVTTFYNAVKKPRVFILKYQSIQNCERVLCEFEK